MVVFVASVTATVAALVVWVVYVLNSVTRIERFATDIGMRSANSHWVVLGVGVSLLALLIVGLSVLLAQALAEQRWSRNQDEFVANITHEMKSPLAAIRLHAQNLEFSALDPDATRSVGFILTESRRLTQLIDNVLESSRLAAPRRLRPRLDPLDLALWLREWSSAAQARVGGHGLQLLVETGSKPAWIAATPAHLTSILDNLVDNAVRFSARDGEVRVRLSGNSEEVVLEVEDDGVGIPKKELALIFERFYQIGREISDRRGGTGLGLSIVSGLVAELDGSIRAYSQEGRPGARFVVELPRLERTP